MEGEAKKIESVDNVVVSSKVLANMFGLTTRRIRQLENEGVIIKTGRGRYNLGENVQKYIVYLKASQALKEENNDSELDLEKEKALLTRRQREKVDLELAAMRGTMHFSHDVEIVMNDMLANFRAKLLAMPTKVAPILIAKNDISEIQEILQSEVFETLQELSCYDPAIFYNEKHVELDEEEELESREEVVKEEDTQ